MVEVDVELKDALAALLPVKHGERDPKSKDGQAGAIAAVQVFLNRSDRIDGGTIPVTGNYLDATTASIREYQKSYNGSLGAGGKKIAENGKLDKETIALMVSDGFDLKEFKEKAKFYEDKGKETFTDPNHGHEFFRDGDTSRSVLGTQKLMKEELTRRATELGVDINTMGDVSADADKAKEKAELVAEKTKLEHIAKEIQLTGTWKHQTETVKEFQKAIGVSYPDGLVGPNTLAVAEKSFNDLVIMAQEHIGGLKKAGGTPDVDAQTRLSNKLASAERTSLIPYLELQVKEINASATNIAAVQIWLKFQDPTYAALLANGEKDGVYGLPGERTKKAITAYQTYTGIPVTGKLDAATLEQMQSGDDGFKLKEAVADLTEDVRKKTDKLDADLAAPHHKGHGGNEHLPHRPRGPAHGRHE